LAGNAVTGRSGDGARAGARTLNMLAAPLNAQILRALREGPKQQADLRREAGHPAQTTLRSQLKKLVDAGAIEKRRRSSFPGVLDYELSEAGADLLAVMATLERWLERAPEASLNLGDVPAKGAVKALTEGWSTTILRMLAAKPLTLTELDRVIASLNYPSLERRLSAMRLAGLVAASEADGRGTPYTVTSWARQGIAPIVAAARWERRHSPAGTAQVAKLDVETAFLLAVDLLSPPRDASGPCRLAVELREGKGPQFAGLLVAVSGGRVMSRTTRLDGDADSWALGSLAAWFAAVIDHDMARLELGGDSALARALVDDLHSALFPLPVAD
jgi:DNA-binding HxlR family transcriptional regulator